jgi:hypothetical protein
MKAFVATLLLVVSAQSALAGCADLNRQVIPNKLAFQAATEEYKNSAISHLRDALNNAEPPPINVISEGVASTSKMITAFDKTIDYLRSVLAAGCFGQDAAAWSAAIAKFETQRDEMRRDRRTYIEILSMMSKVEDRPGE